MGDDVCRQKGDGHGRGVVMVEVIVWLIKRVMVIVVAIVMGDGTRDGKGEKFGVVIQKKGGATGT